ncbi:MAG: BlaI family penicillinase repressor [Planctomycetota bacterium]|jgi:BlaI family penicillinase repressor
MSKSRPHKKPTAAEFNILGVIWELQEATVRQVHEVLSQRQEIGHTTVLKLMQIMTEKGLLARNTKVRPQVFWAAIPKNQTQEVLVGDLLDSAFKGSPSAMVLQALALRKSTPDELREIRNLLDELEDSEG